MPDKIVSPDVEYIFEDEQFTFHELVDNVADNAKLSNETKKVVNDLIDWLPEGEEDDVFLYGPDGLPHAGKIQTEHLGNTFLEDLLPNGEPGLYVSYDADGNVISKQIEYGEVDVSGVPGANTQLEFNLLGEQGGEHVNARVSVAPEEATIPMRTDGGQVRVGEPVLGDAATTKAYVDSGIEAGDVATLEAANQYTDQEVGTAVQNLTAYVDSEVAAGNAATLQAANEYTDQEVAAGNAATLIEANAYTDQEVDAAIVEMTDYTDQEVAQALTEAKEYTDTEVADGDATALAAANAYTDAETLAALASANEYTDIEVAGALAEANSYTDTEVAGANAYTDQETASALANANQYTDDAIAAIPTPPDTYVDSATFSESTSTITLTRTEGLPPLTMDLGILASDLYVTDSSFDQATSTLTINRNGGLAPLSVDLSALASDFYATSASVDGDAKTITIFRNGGLDPIVIDLDPVLHDPYELPSGVGVLTRSDAGNDAEFKAPDIEDLSGIAHLPSTDNQILTYDGQTGEPAAHVHVSETPTENSVVVRNADGAALVETGNWQGATGDDLKKAVNVETMQEAIDNVLPDGDPFDLLMRDDAGELINGLPMIGTFNRSGDIGPLAFGERLVIPAWEEDNFDANPVKNTYAHASNQLDPDEAGSLIIRDPDGRQVGPDPTVPTELANKRYVDNLIEGVVPSGTIEQILSWNNSGELVAAPRNFITPQMYGAVGDGVTDDTAAFQMMAARAAALNCAMCVKGGTYRLSNGFTIFHPATLIGQAGAELLFDNLNNGDGITIHLLNQTGPKGKYNTTEISGFKVRIRGSDGGSFIKTPRGAPFQGTNILNGHAPQYIFRNMQVNGAQSPIQSHVSQVFWECVFDIGESNAAEVTAVVSNGSYDYQAEPTPANTRSKFIRLSADLDAERGALRSPIIRDCVVMNFGRVIDIGKRVSRLQMSHFYAHNCWEGLISEFPRDGNDYSSDENEFTSINFNVQKTGFHIVGTSNGSAFRGVDVTRATGGYNHGQDWHAFFVDNIYRAHFDGCGVRTNFANGDESNGEYSGVHYGVRARTVLALSSASFYQRGMGPGGGLDHLFYIETPRRVSLVGVQSHGTIHNIVTATGTVRPETMITLSNVGQCDNGQLRGQRLLLEGNVTEAQVNDLDSTATPGDGVLVSAAGDTGSQFKYPTFTELTGRPTHSANYGGTIPVYNSTTGEPGAPLVFTGTAAPTSLALRNSSGALVAARATVGTELAQLGQITGVVGISLSVGTPTQTVTPSNVHTVYWVSTSDLGQGAEATILVDPSQSRAGNTVEFRIPREGITLTPKITVATADEDDNPSVNFNSVTYEKIDNGTDVLTVRGVFISTSGEMRFRILSENQIQVSGQAGIWMQDADLNKGFKVPTFAELTGDTTDYSSVGSGQLVRGYAGTGGADATFVVTADHSFDFAGHGFPTIVARMSTGHITSIAPVQGAHVATKAYVDDNAVSNGGTLRPLPGNDANVVSTPTGIYRVTSSATSGLPTTSGWTNAALHHTRRAAGGGCSQLLITEGAGVSTVSIFVRSNRGADAAQWSPWERLVHASEFDALEARVEALENT